MKALEKLRKLAEAARDKADPAWVLAYEELGEFSQPETVLAMLDVIEEARFMLEWASGTDEALEFDTKLAALERMLEAE